MSHKDWFDDEGPDLQGTSWQEISPPTVVDSRKRFGIKESSKTDFSLTSIARNAHGRKLKLQQGDGRQAGAVGSKACMVCVSSFSFSFLFLMLCCLVRWFCTYIFSMAILAADRTENSSWCNHYVTRNETDWKSKWIIKCEL